MTGSYIQLIAALVAMGSLVGVFSYMASKKQKTSNLMNVLSYQNIGQKNGIAALQVGSEVLILGVTQSDFKVLKTIKHKDIPEAKVKSIVEKIDRLKKIKEGIDG